MVDDDTFELDENILQGIAELICGDDLTPHYRRGFEIEKFFKAAGLPVGELEGYRREWTLEQLHRWQHDADAMRRVIQRLADPREYIGDDEVLSAVLTDLNKLLALEGFHVRHEAGRPVIVAGAEAIDRINAPSVAELSVSISEIVHDETFGRQLRLRLDEAYACWRSGAPTAALIMLGSLLEGVLYDAALARRSGGSAPSDNLQSLIATAREERWIAKDVAEYADVLRNHRNLVHPRKQWKQEYEPEEDSVRIAWNVVVAALNDLADRP
ncbi:DUF4145 domain-containing protein [Kribbella speibonae]|uniref:DUF4145 domain-containing protein n=1 Tax=Kribbella speibonae TaxID=1572660 RepID=A0A4R0ITC6_9ACTN|nr:DUF4145 domain-containing protein [Kribbella speibonae]TCC36357.1 DUF4145 domain-containing protein [Kribbella speibonae]